MKIRQKKMIVGHILIIMQVVLLVASAIYCFFYYNPNLEAGTRNMLDWGKEGQQNVIRTAVLLLTIANIAVASTCKTETEERLLCSGMVWFKVGGLLFWPIVVFMLGFQVLILSLGGFQYIPTQELNHAFATFNFINPLCIYIVGTVYGILFMNRVKKRNPQTIRLPYKLLLAIPFVDGFAVISIYKD